jgi:hypothetical protein
MAETLDWFYDETRNMGWVRRRSPEVDFGVNWIGPDGQRGWIEETGEVYASNLSEVVVLAVVASREALEARLRGWPIMMQTKKGTTTRLAEWIALDPAAEH